jgi:mannose-1-phosphate guanylyltransferase
MLVGGRGTRLRPLTLTTPKPLLPAGGVPFLRHPLSGLGAAGIERAVLATSYRAELFRHALASWTGPPSLEYAVEELPLDTGGAVRHALDLLYSPRPDGGNVLVINGDQVSGLDYAALLAAHAERDADVTVHLIPVADPRGYGSVVLDRTRRILEFHEKSPRPPSNLVNAGSYVFRREVLARIPTGRPVSIEREIFPALAASAVRIFGHVASPYWMDIGTPSAYISVCADLVTGVAPTGALPAPPGQALVLPGASVAADAVLTGGSTVGAGAVVGPGAILDGAVLFDRAEVGAGSVLRRCVLGHHSKVGTQTVIEEALIGDGATVGARNELRAGLRVWPDATLSDGALRNG